MTKYQFVKAYDCLGYPMVDTRARFHIPTRYRSSFSIEHHLFEDGKLAAEGFETRVWVGRDPSDPDKIKSTPIPAAVVERLSIA